MVFKNRKDAGEKLAAALAKYRALPKTMAVGLPRGGVVVAAEVAKILQLPLDLIIPRKIGAPFNPELALGAIAGDEVFLDRDLIASLEVPQVYLEQEIAKEKKEALRRLAAYRGGKLPQDFKDWTVLLIDDGVATGSTIRVSIAALKKMRAKKIVVAIPVGPRETIEILQREVNEVICLYIPSSFLAISQFYSSFPQTTDEEVISLLSHQKKG